MPYGREKNSVYMRLLYNFGIYCYKQAVSLVAARNPKARKLSDGQKNIFAYLEKNVDPQGGYLWIHASSLGEFEQGRPMIEAVKKAYPEKKILITFFSPSGYEVRKDYRGADLICYLPFDLPGNVERFLDLVKPSQAIFIKYEFWANYLNALKRRGVPTYIISAIFRPSQIFFRPYGGYFRRILRNFTHLYVQDEASRTLLSGIGVNAVSVVGDTRFDRVMDIRLQAKKLPVVEAFVKGCDKVLVAGSSWPKDEDIFIDYFNRHPEMKLILAPHEIHEAHLHSIRTKLKRPYVLYSQATEQSAANSDCLIIDCFGLLSSMYPYGRMAYVGGGFGAGIHNIAEAAVYGVPVIFGPNYHRFKEARDLISLRGGFTVSEPQTFKRLMDKFLLDSAYLKSSGDIAVRYIESHAGATKKILAHLFDIK